MQIRTFWKAREQIRKTMLIFAHQPQYSVIFVGRKLGRFGVPGFCVVCLLCLSTRPWGGPPRSGASQGLGIGNIMLVMQGKPNFPRITGGILMQRGEIDACIVGTDRTLSNGDVCNKVGTYLKALAAKDNNIPFYVALPSSTIDWDLKNSENIPIEERNSEELSFVEGLDSNNKLKKIRIYPKNSKSLNLAFDVTPAKYITGLITEKGICSASEEGLNKLFK